MNEPTQKFWHDDGKMPNRRPRRSITGCRIIGTRQEGMLVEPCMGPFFLFFEDYRIFSQVTHLEPILKIGTRYNVQYLIPNTHLPPPLPNVNVIVRPSVGSFMEKHA